MDSRFSGRQRIKSLQFQKTLIIMVKSPRAGRVKTRLSSDIGTVAATYFYRKMCNHLICRLSRDPRWRTVLAITPDTDLAAPFWPPEILRCNQGGGDLGKRMQSLFDEQSPGPVVIIGTDIPEITNRHVAGAFRALGSNDAVVGPGDDGGYWLVGLKRIPKVPDIFENVRWSSAHTLPDTLQNLSGYDVAHLEVLNDVDTGGDYQALKRFASRLVCSGVQML